MKWVPGLIVWAVFAGLLIGAYGAAAIEIWRTF